MIMAAIPKNCLKDLNLKHTGIHQQGAKMVSI